jgi:hypothetical protein
MRVAKERACVRAGRCVAMRRYAYMAGEGVYAREGVCACREVCSDAKVCVYGGRGRVCKRGGLQRCGGMRIVRERACVQGGGVHRYEGMRI